MLKSLFNKWVFLVLMISVLVSLRRTPEKSVEPETELTHPIFSVFLQRDEAQEDDSSSVSNLYLEYDYYRETCPYAEKIVSSRMAQIYAEHRDVSAGLLRLFFHDCFIRGCDASVFLDDSNGNKSYLIERQAIPHTTLKGFDQIDLIKEELEMACPGVVSCADTLALATRDGILLAGGPYYPVFTGRRDSIQSYYQDAMNEVPGPDDNLDRILQLFSVKGFNKRETVSLLGGHNIGNISCEFIRSRLYNFMGTGQPDPTMADDFMNQMRLSCHEINGNSADMAPSPMRSRMMTESTAGMSYYQGLTSSISSGAGFDTHYYQSLLTGRGLLYSDQQLMADEKTANLVRAYASDDGTSFRVDFARAMVKLSNLVVLYGSQGQVRTNCSLPANNP
ncbi:hypothetical protein ACOSQ2_027974 [Xanthoceras sorbifolium]|uniref:Peroxidase n=1 Tax=Xanthoceras sorbifolium TaxID=99658 RepID=A0ABQ8GZA0_9ROSI|nr:hypothetical protein JRO89_XSUnG0195500 [Xanthoceras sorbifolium]